MNLGGAVRVQGARAFAGVSMSGRIGSMLTIALLMAIASLAAASGLGSGQTAFDFTKPDEIGDRVRWSHADRMDLTAEGLGWNGEEHASFSAWVQTESIGIGTSHRPSANAGIRVIVDRDWSWPHRVGTINAYGRLYVRYGPDGTHWSSWHVLPGRRDAEDPAKGTTYGGEISVPRRERVAYEARLREYRARDVPWKSDEQAACRWIVEQDPRFFEKNNPFVGYVQLLYETSIYGGHRIRGMKVNVNWVLPGPYSPPKVKGLAKDRFRKPWGFLGKKESEVETLDWTHVRDDGCLHVAAGAADRELDLRGTRITDRGLASIAALTELRSLNLSSTEVTGRGLAHIGGLTRLERLDLSRTRNVGNGLVHLKGLRNLKVLDLKSSDVGGAAIAHLAALTSLEDLDLLGSRLRPEALAVIGKLTALRRLCLWSCRVTDEGLAHLAGLTELRSLLLSGSVTDAGVEHLAAMVRMEELGLTRTKITDATLARLVRMPALKRLSLGGTAVTDAGLVHLAKLENLERLWIDGTAVTDAGLAHLAGLTGMKSLHLADTGLTDAGLVHLAGMKELENLSINGTAVTEEAVARLKARLPKLRSVW
jgi:Leucine Rich repeat